MNFKSFLLESLDVEKLKHLEHLEDHMIHGGHEGVAHASETLSDVVAILEGKPRKSFGQQTRITTKYDGAPSIVFGINPENGKFFVASKSAFNKNPKLNYNERDIEENHGHAPGLVAKLKEALKELPKIMPNGGGVFQGDLMYTKEDLTKNKDGSLSFTPNTITYTTDNPEQTRSAEVSNLGVVVHSRYIGKTLADAKVSFDVDQSQFKRNPDVHMINPEISGANIKPIEKKKYEAELQQALDIYSTMDDDVFNVVDGHDVTMKTYINACVRDGSMPDGKGYLNFVKTRGQKEIDKAKSPDGKAKKKAAADAMTSHVKNHMDQFNALFRMHKCLQQAKDTLTVALSNTVDTGLKTTIGGKPTKPEGFVAIRGGRPTKLVDRADFSAANFAVGAFQKASKEEEAAAEDLNPVVTSFGRMNPPTHAGHGAVVGKVSELSKEMKAPSVIALSRSQDPEKNPLSPEQKIKHAKRMFPDANIMLADEDAKTVIAHIKKLNQKGHNHLVLVVGSDRVAEMQKLLEKYNGSEFNFKKIDVVSAGQRDMDSDVEEPDEKPAKDETPEQKKAREEKKRRGMSATKMRGHAISGRFGEFKAGMHPDVHDEHAREMYQDVRQGMDIKIDSNTSGISLARYAKRKDPIGVKARREIQRREQVKESEAKVKLARKPVNKPIKEDVNMTVGVAGLGLVSGSPAIDDEQSGNYVAQNTADSDQKDNILHLWIKAAQHHEKRLGFKEFSPKNKR
jgi:nicotinamide mononucleotide adenylyltransferase